jgi:hypothetical protein
MEARYDINPAPDVTTEKELKQLMRENGEKSQQDHDRFIKRIDRKNAQARDTLTSLREANAKLRAQGARGRQLLTPSPPPTAHALPR